MITRGWERGPTPGVTPENLMIYLASPYSHPDPAVQQRRFEQVCGVASALMRNGTVVFSPIAHSHCISLAGGLPGDFIYWEEFDRTILSVCKALLVLKLEGWEESAGIKSEIAIMQEMGKPVGFLDYIVQ